MSEKFTIDSLFDATVFDQDGDKIGGVKQVYTDNRTNEPTWIAVGTGMFGTNETLIPLGEARVSGEEIHVPFEKSFIKDAPNVEADHELTAEDEQRLYDYYGDKEYGSAEGYDRDYYDEHYGDRKQGDVDARHGDVDGRGREGDAAMAGTAAAGAGYAANRDGDRREGHLDQDVNDRDRDLHRDGDVRRDGDVNDRDLHRDGDVRRDGDVDRDRNAGQGAGVGDVHVTDRVEDRDVQSKGAGLRLRKHVVTEKRTVEVPVTHEEVVVEDGDGNVVDGNNDVVDGNNDVVDGNNDVVDGNNDVVDGNNRR